MWQMNDADLNADRQSTDLLFVHQTHWQRTLLEKYGNEICLQIYTSSILFVHQN